MNLLDVQLESDLIHQLNSLSYPAWTAALTAVLEKMGYDYIATSARRKTKGRHDDGGFDLSAVRPVGGGQRKVVIQAKQYGKRRSIARKFVDELRGVCVRTQAAEGLLITTGEISRSVDKAAFASEPMVPIRLIDGHTLANLMAFHRIGVWEQPGESGSVPSKRGIDPFFFAELEDCLPPELRGAGEGSLAIRDTAACNPGKMRILDRKSKLRPFGQ